MMSLSWGIAIFVLLATHTYLITKNWTTLEMGALMQEKDIFKDLTAGQRWEQTMGKNRLLWFLPIGGPSPDQGLDYSANIPMVGVIPLSEAADEEAPERPTSSL